MATTLEGQCPWRPGYVPYGERPLYTTLAEGHAVAPGYWAFVLDPEVGVAGAAEVAWIAGDYAGVRFSLHRDETREQIRRGERHVWRVRREDLRDTVELAQLAARGRGMLMRMGVQVEWPAPVRWP